MSKSNDLSLKLLNHALGGPDYVRPATVYLGFFTSDPGEGVGGTEATGTGYARTAITNNATNFPAATGSTIGTKSNAVAFTGPTAGVGGWSSGANMTHWALFDAASGGNRMYKGALQIAKPVLEGDSPSVAIGAIVITED